MVFSFVLKTHLKLGINCLLPCIMRPSCMSVVLGTWRLWFQIEKKKKKQTLISAKDLRDEKPIWVLVFLIDFICLWGLVAFWHVGEVYLNWALAFGLCWEVGGYDSKLRNIRFWFLQRIQEIKKKKAHFFQR